MVYNKNKCREVQNTVTMQVIGYIYLKILIIGHTGCCVAEVKKILRKNSNDVRQVEKMLKKNKSIANMFTLKCSTFY